MYVILTSKPGKFRTEIVDGLRPLEAYDYLFYGEKKARFVIAELLKDTKIRVIEEGTLIVNDVPSKFFDKFATVERALIELKHLTSFGSVEATLEKVARLAARRQDRQTLKHIEIVLNKGTAAVAAKRFDQLSDLNQQFHRELAEAGQNRVLGELLRKLRERTAMLFSPNDPVRQARSWNEHAAILRAIIEGDERAAATLAAEHVTRAGADFLFGLGAFEEGSPLPPSPRPKGTTKLRSGVLRVPSMTHDATSRREAPPDENAGIRAARGRVRRDQNNPAGRTKSRARG